MSLLAHQPGPTTPQLALSYAQIRQRSVTLAAPLSEADCQVQSMPETSPVKWHLAHTTWFFETFLLQPLEPDFKPFNPAFRVLFNSYYNGVGEQHPRAQRGSITRPGLDEVLVYRRAVDERMAALLDQPHHADWAATVELGLQHEQQHQELILTDVLHLLSNNPQAPVYQPGWPLAAVAPVPLQWVAQAGGLVNIGRSENSSDSSDGSDSTHAFAFDNESPQHPHWLQPYALANRLVTHGEWLTFVDDGAYRDPRWWAAAGWDWVRQQQIQAPLYWRHSGAGPDPNPSDWHSFTLHGLVPLDACTPITHISWFEADAFARWWSAQHPQLPAARLPTEFEWEHAAQTLGPNAIGSGNFVETGALHPMPVSSAQGGLLQMLGDVWEWTASSYLPYPGFKPWSGTVGEYNAKFMVNQMVLRGGSCVTPRSHIRTSYRNFFPTDARWQFNGLRLARDLS